MKVVYEEVPYEDSNLARIEAQYVERTAEVEPEPEPAKKSRTKAAAD